MLRSQKIALAGGVALVASLLTFAVPFACEGGDCAVPVLYLFLRLSSLLLGLVLLALACALYLGERRVTDRRV